MVISVLLLRARRPGIRCQSDLFGQTSIFLILLMFTPEVLKFPWLEVFFVNVYASAVHPPRTWVKMVSGQNSRERPVKTATTTGHIGWMVGFYWMSENLALVRSTSLTPITSAMLCYVMLCNQVVNNRNCLSARACAFLLILALSRSIAKYQFTDII